MLIAILIAAMIVGTASLDNAIQNRVVGTSLAKAGEVYMAC